MGGVGLIRELSAGGEGWREASQGRAPSASCLSLPRWKHACSLTWEHLQWDLIKMEMVGMECGGGCFLDSQQLLGSSLGHIISSAS